AVLAAQALVRAGVSPQLVLVTRGAQAVGVAVGLPPAVGQAAMLGLGRALQVEHPELQCRRIDLAPGSDATQAAHWLAGELAVTGETEVALRSDGRYAPRLVARTTIGPRMPFSCRPDGTYVVSGGLGGLGREVSKWLVQRGARHLLLVGRRDPSAAEDAFIAELRASGAQVHVSSTGVTDPVAVRKLFADVKATMPEVRGVVHVAGLLDDGIFAELTWPKMTRVMAPKVQGAWNLHINTVGLPLDFLVFFSSVSALWGAAGQANYAAANAWLDSLAQARRAAGLAALSVNWGPWNAGMAATGGAKAERRWRDQGLAMMQAREALPALEHLLVEKATHAAVFAIAERGRFLEHQQRGFRTLFDEWEHEAPPASSAPQPISIAKPAAKASGLIEQLAAAPGSQRLPLITGFLQKIVRKQLGGDASQRLSPQQPFMDMGLDSLMLANVRRELMAAVGKSLPVTIGFDYPTLEALATHLADDVLGIEKSAPEPAPAAKEDVVAALLDRMATLSDSEAEALLAAKLGGLRE
ncbi:MAG TPA: beta-ketoacyl reductase, partial [Myxococcota bacterium]|nr:beta-ketoacyl reductase [Myxococcota bacterium]